MSGLLGLSTTSAALSGAGGLVVAYLGAVASHACLRSAKSDLKYNDYEYCGKIYTKIALGILAGLVATTAAAGSTLLLGTAALCFLAPAIALTVAKVLSVVVAGAGLGLLFQAVRNTTTPPPADYLAEQYNGVYYDV